MSKLVSIVIPTFKRINSLKRSIDSCVVQTYGDIEIIAVDDNGIGTEYNTEVNKLIASFSDVRLRYIEHDRNMNGAVARNTGIRHSNGHYICFLDDDDYFDSKKIKEQVNYLERNQHFDGVSCGLKKGNQTILDNRTGNLVESLLMMDAKLPTSTLFFKATVFNKILGFDEEFLRHQDYEFLVRYFQYFEIGYVNEPLVFFGSNRGENMLKGKDLENMKSNFLNIFNPVIDEFGTNFKTKCLCKHYCYMMVHHIKTLHFKYVAINFYRCMKLSPKYFFHYFIQRINLK